MEARNWQQSTFDVLITRRLIIFSMQSIAQLADVIMRSNVAMITWRLTV